MITELGIFGSKFGSIKGKHSPTLKGPENRGRCRFWVLGTAIVFSSLVSIGASAETRYELGLREAIALALSKNYSVQMDRLNPERAEQRVRRAEGAFDPSLTLAAGVDSEEVLDVEGSDLRRNASVTIEGILPWGTQYRVDVGSDDRRDDFLDRAVGANGGSTLRVTQPLLRDFGKGANYAGVRIARNGFAQSKQELRARVMGTVADTIVAYSNLHFAKESLEIALTNRDLAKQLMDDNERRLEVGSIATADVREAESRYAQRKETVLLAEQFLREQENVMKRLISVSIEELLDLRVDVSGLEEPGVYGFDLRNDFAESLELRPDYQLALLGVDTDRLELDRDRQQRLPNLDLVGQLGYDGRGSSMGGSVSNLRDDPAKSYSFQTVFSMPLPNRTDRAQYEVSRIDLEQAEIGIEELKQSILIRLDNAARRVTLSWQRIEVTREARELTEKSLEAEVKKFELGASRSFFVLEQQRDLANAQIREKRAITDYHIYLARYELEKGSILEVYGISSYE